MIMLKHESVRQAVQYELDTLHAKRDPCWGYDPWHAGYEAALLDYLERLDNWHRMPGELGRLPLDAQMELHLLDDLKGTDQKERWVRQVFGSLPAEVQDRARGYLEGLDTLERVLLKLINEEVAQS